MQKVRPIGADAVHLCIDMQRLFAEKTAWHTASIRVILPAVLRLVRHAPERTIFTRFVTPRRPRDAPGHWRPYYERWRGVTTSVAGAGIVELMDELKRLVPPARVADKTTYSAFGSARLGGMLAEAACRTVICSGVETDVCVLATVMDAMDLGYRVVLPSDAVHGSDHASHRAALDHIYRRFEDQIEIGSVDEVLAGWSRP